MSKHSQTLDTEDPKGPNFEVPQNEPSSADADTPTAPDAEAIIRGRNVEVPEHFSRRINGKLARLERLDPTIQRFEVELRHEKNPRQGRTRNRVEITARGKGAPARAEAGEDSFYAALEAACEKLERSLRKVKVRRKVSQSGHRTPTSLAEATSGRHSAFDGVEDSPTAPPADEELGAVDPYEDQVEDVLPGRVVRTKTHPETPMTVDDALYEMELVGHDFFLFHNAETDKASVVYRRHAYDYGLISLGE